LLLTPHISHTPTQVTSAPGGVEIVAATGGAVDVTWAKMSKSKYNGVDPAQTVKEHGADAARVFVLFKAPPSAVLDWDSNAIHGVERWLHRVWALVHEHADAQRARGDGSTPRHPHESEAKTDDETATSLPPSSSSSCSDAADISRAAHAAVRSVTRALGETHSFNTAVSDLMKLSNALKPHAASADAAWAVRALVVMLSPAAPHIAAELWHEMRDLPAGGAGWNPDLPVFEQQWPEVDEDALRTDTIELPVQVGVAHFSLSRSAPSVLVCYVSLYIKGLRTPCILVITPSESACARCIERAP
jgi:leucyl-tRNA synthetase